MDIPKILLDKSVEIENILKENVIEIRQTHNLVKEEE